MTPIKRRIEHTIREARLAWADAEYELRLARMRGEDNLGYSLALRTYESASFTYVDAIKAMTECGL